MAETQTWGALKTLLETLDPADLDAERTIEASNDTFYAVACLNGNGGDIDDEGMNECNDPQTWGQLLNLLDDLTTAQLAMERTILIDEEEYDSVAKKVTQGGSTQVKDKGARPNA